MKKILIANIFGIGDVLFTTPLITNLKEGIKNVFVDYLCNARTKDIVGNNPDVNEVLVYEKDFYRELWRRSRIRCLQSLLELFLKIRRNRYDAVFDFTLSRKFGFVFMLAGIRRRIGLDYRKRGIFLTEKIPFDGFEGRHVVEYYLDLLGRVNVTVREKKLRLVAGTAKKNLPARSPKLVAIIPGGGASWGRHASRKRWNAKGFSGVGDILAEKGYEVIIVGDASEKALCAGVAENMKKKPLDIRNDLSLASYMALLSECELVLCNDGGPLHMAVALGTKTVSIFGPVDEAVYGPYPISERHKVVKAGMVSCRPCYGRFKLPECRHAGRCLTEINPAIVADACLSLLDPE